MDQCCRTCGFFEAHTCKRHAPVRGEHGVPLWPRVMPGGWCGDYALTAAAAWPGSRFVLSHLDQMTADNAQDIARVLGNQLAQAERLLWEHAIPCPTTTR